ncbi:ATP-binding protein [Streptomyces adustus]|uniref:ATP-binding protein n=1 Tax=Streptomyces adustus TaxID=1609272 RepID=UPI00372178A9
MEKNHRPDRTSPATGQALHCDLPVRMPSASTDTAALPVAELAANAVTHGRVPGRDFEVRLTLEAYTLRIEVSDPRGGRRPGGPDGITAPSAALEDGGRGLLLVEALADRWAVLDRLPVGETIRAELLVGYLP